LHDINREHPEYAAFRETYRRYRDLYAGGEQFRANSSSYLVQRHREPPDIYGERLERVFFENYVGSIIDWYAAALFRREPILAFESASDRTKRFYSSFAEDCDLRGSTLSDFFRRQLVSSLVGGKSYITVDFPKAHNRNENRAQEELQGVSRAFLSEYPAESVINWSKSPHGDFDWLVLRSTQLMSSGPQDAEWTQETRWVYYDRSRYQVYSKRGQDPKTTPTLVDEGFHGLASQGVVPVFEFSVGDGLWLMNKAAALQLEHFNKSNALAWALTMGLFAMPVVYSDREWKQVMGESYYIQLGPEDKFGWTEPAGHVYEIALKNLDRLKEEIYRVCYLMNQSGGSLSKAVSLSGLSKQRDYLVTQEVLRRFGDSVKDIIKLILQAILVARQDQLRFEVSGLDEFDIGEFSGELSDAKELLNLGIDSQTMKRQIYKKLAFKYLCDAQQQVKSTIAQEIDTQFGTTERR
jgi:hypothetical protein